MVTTKLTTIEDIEQIPDDDHRYALIRGVLYRMMPPGPLHGWTTARLTRFLGNYADEHDLGAVFTESGWVLQRDPDVLLAPDLCFVRADRLPPEGPWVRFPDLAPDLVVEVISPSETGPDVETKMREYLAAGVRLIWAIDPQRRTIRVRTASGDDLLLTENDELDGGDVLPGFRLAVKLLFA